MNQHDDAAATTTTIDREDAAATVVRATVDIAAPPERVFDALVDPARLGRWWGTSDTHRARDWAVDPRPGGALRARVTHGDGSESEAAGAYRVVDPPRTVEHTWRASPGEPESVVRFDLAPADVRGRPGTRVTVTHTIVGFAAQAAAHAAGWPLLLARLALHAGAPPTIVRMDRRPSARRTLVPART